MSRRQVIRRSAEVCSCCGGVEPFSTYASRKRNGMKIMYLACRYCGARAVRIVTVDRPK